MASLQTVAPGVYRHFKGNMYLALGIVRHSETQEPLVLYRALYGEGGLWVRPAEMFASPVDQKKYPQVEQEFRFQRLPDDEARATLDCLRAEHPAWELPYMDGSGRLVAANPKAARAEAAADEVAHAASLAVAALTNAIGPAHPEGVNGAAGRMDAPGPSDVGAAAALAPALATTPAVTPATFPMSADERIEADERFMRQALALARLAARVGEVPIGAVVVCDGQIVAAAHNRREMDNDPSAHAEFSAMVEAARALGRWRLTGCTVYVTVEPCVMCAGLMHQARVSRCVFGAPDPKAGALGSLYQVHNDERLNHRFEVVAGVLQDECAQVMREFFASRRMMDEVDDAPMAPAASAATSAPAAPPAPGPAAASAATGASVEVARAPSGSSAP